MDAFLSLFLGPSQTSTPTGAGNGTANGTASSAPASSTGQAELDRAFSRASAATGLPFDFFLTTAMRESSLDVNAAASTSSARGPFQFIEQTWLSMVHEHGQSLGLSDQAQAIDRSANGRFQVNDPTARDSILAMRHDPELSAVMTGLYVQENAVDLENALGRQVTVGEGYVAHVFGPSGGARLISLAEQQPNRVAADVFPTQAAANQGLFYSRTGEPVSVSALYERLTGGFSDQAIDTSRQIQLGGSAPGPSTSQSERANTPLALEPAGFDALPEAVETEPDDFARRGMFSASSNAAVPFFAALYRPEGWQASQVGEEFVATHDGANLQAEATGDGQLASPSVPNPIAHPSSIAAPLDLVSFVENGQLIGQYRNPVLRPEGSQLVPPV